MLLVIITLLSAAQVICLCRMGRKVGADVIGMESFIAPKLGNVLCLIYLKLRKGD